MRTVHVEPPTELGTRDGLAYALFLPAARARRRRRDPPRRRLAQGEPLRLRPRVRAAGPGGGRLRPARPRRERRRAGRPARSTTSRRWPALLPPGPVALRGSSMGGFMALHGRRAHGRARRVVAICPATAASSSRAGCATARFDFRADRDALQRAAGRGRRAGGRRRAGRARCCSCTPRATSRSRSSSRARCTPPRPAAASSRCPAAITARSSTTPSCRRSPCASSRGHCGRAQRRAEHGRAHVGRRARQLGGGGAVQRALAPARGAGELDDAPEVVAQARAARSPSAPAARANARRRSAGAWRSTGSRPRCARAAAASRAPPGAGRAGAASGGRRAAARGAARCGRSGPSPSS